MPVYFANVEPIDMDVIRVMGVSVKSKTDAIGYFGTGLKYAIATLLRTGHTIIMERDGEEFVFTAREVEIRGETKLRVFMNEEALAFTVDLGRNWEVWQAYRELYSNVLDEDGVICDRIKNVPENSGTVIKVNGPTIDVVHADRHQIFIQTDPILSTQSIEVHEGPSNYLFYRGVRVAKVPGGTTHTYNFTRQMELTEDRTIKSMFDAQYVLGRELPQIDDEKFHRELLQGGDAWDQSLEFSYCSAPSDAFYKVAEKYYKDARASRSARYMVEKNRQDKAQFPAAQLTKRQKAMLDEAMGFLEKMGCTVERDELEFVKTCGENVLGLYHRGRNQIYVSMQSFEFGMETVVGTIYEEWLHKHRDLKDNSRQMQDHLLRALVVSYVQRD
jgi:hypothetical protein